jgi:tetratricopeptide (TPR) repeat protein
MSTPCFLAETPRGKSGHCFIAPPGYEQRSEQVASFCRVARRHAIGHNFMAVQHQVKQRTSIGERERSGDEVLLLVGVNIAQLTNGQKQDLVAVLERRLRDFAQLLERIDWDREQQGALVIRQEFAVWVADDRLTDLPVASVDDRPLVTAREEHRGGTQERHKTHGDGQRKYLVPFLLGIVLLTSVTTEVITGWISKGGSTISQAVIHWIGKPPPPPDPERKNFEIALQTLASAYGDTSHEEKLLQALYRRISQGTAPQDTAGGLSTEAMRDALYQQSDIREALDYYRRATSIRDPYMFLAESEIAPELRALLDHEPYTVEMIRDARRLLAHFAAAFVQLQKDATESGVSAAPSDDPFVQVVLQVLSLACRGCKDSDPLLPFFSVQDEDIIRIFRALWLQERVPLRAVLPQRDYPKLYGSEGNLASFLHAIEEYQPKISAKIRENKAQAERQVQNTTTLGQLVKAYNGLEDFFQKLGTPLPPLAVLPPSGP